MDRFVITGGSRLEGDVTANGAKNAVLPILAACLLSDGCCVLHNVPVLNDVKVMFELLRLYGVQVQREGSSVIVDARNSGFALLDQQLCREMRASGLLLGAAVSRFGEAVLPYPGGCAIGTRPMNYHLQALEGLGADIKEEGGFLEAKCKQLKGCEICFDFPSVGATENAMLAAVKAQGRTVIRNAAREPELVDLANFLQAMGACISGAGSDIITIEGVDFLDSVEYRIMPDRIETGTLLCAAAQTMGDVLIRGACAEHQTSLLAKLQAAGARIDVAEEGIRIRVRERLRAVDVQTMPYSGFATDMQSQFMALMCVARGTAIITENVFENRFKQVDGLCRMGADIKLIGRAAVVNGHSHLVGATVCATDLRAGAALVCAGLGAKGVTVVEQADLIDRGYQSIEHSLVQLGANISRVSECYSASRAKIFTDILPEQPKEKILL